MFIDDVDVLYLVASRESTLDLKFDGKNVLRIDNDHSLPNELKF